MNLRKLSSHLLSDRTHTRMHIHTGTLSQTHTLAAFRFLLVLAGLVQVQAFVPLSPVLLSRARLPPVSHSVTMQLNPWGKVAVCLCVAIDLSGVVSVCFHPSSSVGQNTQIRKVH